MLDARVLELRDVLIKRDGSLRGQEKGERV